MSINIGRRSPPRLANNLLHPLRLRTVSLLCRSVCVRAPTPWVTRNMGDLLLKQKPPRIQPHWQSNEMLYRKPFPPMYQHKIVPKATFNFRPSEPRWREPSNYYQTPVMYNSPVKQTRDYHFMAPYYRNMMPPPPNPNRLLMVDPRRRISVKSSEPPCQCRSKSMEDVRTDVVEVTADWQHDYNGNRVSPTKSADKFGRFSNRRSMENLLVDTDFSPSSKRNGRFQVLRKRKTECWCQMDIKQTTISLL